ncbi:PREDICTED: prolyl 3-hydroxylase OGFOD1 [Dufourea novaeangliae]|uniref:uS12 prolyl 3-hydroxylase n=1 Tax=Dufourea novaeangliae TaxID=178035 RepID=A0A154P597_DUFNO|nr:PREDICTED: prolyl 3-hydroxylase OGFOD1 [Dufourea novaeangliae]KZC07106.1 2-oxoglutarate and iron-dependent oxygenase domain-containing protein 1 [Dufourea novaeangliae]
MAQEEPELKKLKHSVISDHVYLPDFQKLFYEHWHNFSDIKKDNLEMISQPFRVCKISHFLRNEDFMDEIKNELLDVKSRRNSIDLYQFEQTSDLANVDTKNLKLLYETFQTDLATWMEQNTKIDLNKKISMSSSCYSDTDYLLCHDDNMGDRRIAFILYLSKNWTVEDGGALDLFDTDGNGLPRNVVKSLVPEYNSLVFFEVVDNSYHQVAEVISPEKSRWSINGWFHGPLRESNKPPRPDTEPNYIGPVNKHVSLDNWITMCYLLPGIVKEIQQDMEQESFAFLSNFLVDDIYEKLATDVSSGAIVWQKVGPADICNYEIAKEETLPELLKEFYNMFKSISMFQLLKDYTELDLVPEKETMKPKMLIELQRWSKGCYTLISDKSLLNDATGPINEKKSSNGCMNKDEEGQDDSLDTPRASKSNRNCREKWIANNDSKNEESGCNSPTSNKEDEEVNEDEVLKIILKGKSPRLKKKNLSQQSSSSKLENISPQKLARVLDTDDSDVSDIGDYLSDPLDCSLECSDQEEDMDDANASEPGTLDVIIQFHTGHVPEEDTIDYVDPREQEGALIHVPAKNNHLCLVYKTLGTSRVHKYVNHYCTDYFYNLICTYYE